MDWKRRRNRYHWVVITSAGLALLYTFVTALRPFEWTMGIFAALLLYMASYRVEVENTTFHVLIPIVLPALVLFGPAWASLIIMIGFLSRDTLKLPLPILLFNEAMFVCSMVVAGKVYVLWGGVIGSFHLTPAEIIALFAAGFSFEFTNVSLAAVSNYFLDKIRGIVGKSYLNLIWHGVRTFIFSSTLAGVALIAYQQYYVIGLLTVFFVATQLRQLLMKAEIDEHYQFAAMADVLRAVHAKNAYLREHMVNVAKYSMWIAKNFESLDLDLKTFYQAVFYHDIGKLEIPESLLINPGQLSKEDWKLMTRHPVLGAQFVKDFKTFNARQRKMMEDIAYYHHERFDGSGYPRGLKGGQIPMAARIVAVADAWDAMTTTRSYRLALSRDKAKEELKKGSGTQFDPVVVEAFLKILEEEDRRDDDRQRRRKALMSTWYGKMWSKIFWR